MTDEERRWLTLSAASKLLGVHPATLRHWADAGQVRSYRTPGGHRRFDAADLREFLVKASTPGARPPDVGPDAALLETALVQTRSELRQTPPDEKTWYSAFDEEGRKRQRLLGRQLYEEAVRFITHPEQREQMLLSGRVLGKAYAESSLQYDISLLETVEAFQFFRENLLQALTSADANVHSTDLDEARLRQDVDLLLNEVLFGLIDAYENELLGTILTEQD